jgi:hypothetical protein
LLSAGGAETPYQQAHSQIPTKRLMERMVKEAGVRSTV